MSWFTSKNLESWIETEHPEDEDSYMLLNPQMSPLPSEEEVLTGEQIRENISSLEVSKCLDSDDPDVIKQEFNTPVAANVERVHMDYDTGLIEVYNLDDCSRFVLAAIGSKGGFTALGENGGILTSTRQEAPAPTYQALVETLKDEFAPEEKSGRQRTDLGLKSPTKMYEEVLKDGSYQVPEGDCEFKGLDNVKGNKQIKGDANVARNFFDTLDRIAEFLTEYEEQYNTSDNYFGFPITPLRDKGSEYKFRIPGTNNDTSIVIDQDYQGTESGIEVEVKGLSDHDGDTNLY